MKWLPSIDAERFAILERPVSVQEVSDYRRATGMSRWSVGFDVSQHDAIVLGLTWVIFCIGTVVLMSLTPHWLVLLVMTVSLVAILLVVLVRASDHATRRHVRMSDFAVQCGLGYNPIGSTGAVGLGLIFDVGHSRRYRGVLFLEKETERMLEIGRYSYTLGRGRDQRTYHWWYASLRLGRALPHLILDSKDNNSRLLGRELLSNLPAIIPNSQRVSLEGDFDTHFTLYAPKQYGVDVRYILTPDVMATMVDEAASFDMEVVDDRLFFYAPRGNESDVEALQSIYQALSSVGRKLYSQTDRYADERVTNARQRNVVGQHGRRLKHWKKPL